MWRAHLGGTPTSPGQVFPHRTQSLPIRADEDWQPECSSNLVMLDGITANLERYMDLLSARQKTVASNIANADTPGYKSQDIDFQFEFMTLSKGEQPQIIQTPGLPDKTDGNNVNLDQQARLLSENQMRFNLASVLVRGQLKTVQEAIQGGSSAS
jgi:flagellar basal-body rod protein FlgB